MGGVMEIGQTLHEIGRKVRAGLDDPAIQFRQVKAFDYGRKFELEFVIPELGKHHWIGIGLPGANVVDEVAAQSILAIKEWLAHERSKAMAS